MNRILYFSLLFILFSNCSFNSKSNFWTKEKKIIEEKKNVTIYKFSKDKKSLTKELNKNVKLKINSKLSNNTAVNNLDNNDGMINFDGDLIKSSKYKFSKIKNFNKLEPDLIFHENGLFFFDNKGTILKFDNSSKLIWKKNIYTKKEKKLNPILFFASNKKTLIVTDSIGNYYSLDPINGKLLWKNVHSSPFNSQIKIYDDKFFTVDFESTLNCISIINGNKLWEVKTEDTFVKSIKKISLIIKNNLVIFNNAIGDITAVDIITGSLVWQTPTQSSAIYAEAFKLKISDIISESNSIYFSNNMDEFYSLNLESGLVKWKQNINSTLRPTVVENLIFTISSNGLLVVMEKKTGNIVRVTDVFSDLKDKQRKKIKPIGFIVGLNNIYLTLNNGKLLVVDIKTGSVNTVLKIDNEKVSAPIIQKQNLYVTKNNSIIKLN